MSEPIIQTTNLSATFQALRSRDPNKIRLQKIEEHQDYKRIPNNNFAPIATVHTGSWGSPGITKVASGSSGIIYGQPQFFSPVHTPINWQIPSKRLEQYQWARFFYENEPKVASSIDFYASFPMSDWDHECKDRKVKQYFDQFKKRLDLTKWCRLISHEIHLLGDCFPMIELSCPHCNGSGKLNGEICEHEGGTVRRLVILNPDFVDVFSSPLNPDPVIALRPDEELINMVQRKVPGYEKLNPEVIKLISSGQPIRLDTRNVTHLKYGECGYTKFGVGMIRRLFPILSYKTKLMVAQWIVAERLIIPIKVVKVGSEERPAGPADIAAVQAQLASTANDPNLTIVTHHAFEVDWVGSAGKVLTLSNEFEVINQEILDGLMINKALLNGEGPAFCHSDDTRILTNNGLKYRIELDIENDLIATFNKKNGALEYQKAIKKWEFDWNTIDGNSKPMKHFITNRMDILVTPNHKMLYAPRKLTTGPKGQKIDGQKESFGDWQTADASEIKPRSRFRACFDSWNGKTLDDKNIFNIERLDFLKIVGWYISEGWRCIDKRRNNKIYRIGIAQSPTANPETHNTIKQILQKYSIYHSYPSRKDAFMISNKMNRELVKYLSENCGEGSKTKKIPKELKELDRESLKTLLYALVDGDGSERVATKKEQTNKKYYTYSTVSTQLRDDVIEILFKLGYSPRFNAIKFDSPNLQTKYDISWGETNIGKFPVLASRDQTVSPQKSKQVIFDEDYIGKVWCVEVPNHFIVTERNGLFAIHGNSSASVGIEAMIQRLKTFRQQVSEWIEKFIYLPEAKRQGFIDKNKETNEDEYIVPKIKWHKMHLRDEQQHRTFMVQLYEKGIVSAQTLLEIFELDPDQEIERKRYDAIQMMALGKGAEGQGGPGGGPGAAGGMPDLGGLIGGGGGGGEPPISAPPDGGGMPVGGAEGGGPIVAKSEALSAEVADPSQFGGRILKRKTREKLQNEQQKIYNKQHKKIVDSFGQQRDEKGRIIFTKPERELISHMTRYIKDGIIRYPIQPQYRLNTGGEEYPIDFAIVPLKLGIEADGEMFHGSPEQEAKDKQRDMKLAQIGWTIVRFKDYEIEDQPQQVMSSILQHIMKKEMLMKQQYENYKKAEVEKEIKKSSAAHDLLEQVNNNIPPENQPT